MSGRESHGGVVADPRLARAEAAFEARLRRYRELGHDREAAVRWIVDAAGDLRSPVLDIGTGKGLLAVELARRGHEVTSVDPSEFDQRLAVERARRAGLAESIRFVVGDAGRLDAPAGAFATAAMMDVLHHLDDAEPLFAHVSDLVRRGGRFVVAEFTAEGFAMVARVHGEEGGAHHVSSVTQRGAGAILRRLGWRAISAAIGNMHEVVVYERG